VVSIHMTGTIIISLSVARTRIRLSLALDPLPIDCPVEA
jgi:hypothetical protein